MEKWNWSAIFLLLVVVLAPVLAQGEGGDLESKIVKASAIDSSGKTGLLQILNELTAGEGTLDESVPKRTMLTPEGNRLTVFVFDLQAEHEAAFNELLGYFKNKEGYKLVKEASKDDINGVELYNGNTRISLIKKSGILVEYRIEEAFKRIDETNVTKPTGEAAVGGKTDWRRFLAPAAVVVAVSVAAFFFFRNKIPVFGNVSTILPKIPPFFIAKKQQQEQKKPENGDKTRKK